jgi:hypothetical protein
VIKTNLNKNVAEIKVKQKGKCGWTMDDKLIKEKKTGLFKGDSTKPYI